MSEQSINPETKSILDEYLADMKLNNKSQKTIYQYQRYLMRFFSECQKPITDITYDDVYSFIKKYHPEKLYKPRSINTYISILTSFFNYCVGEEYIETIPIKRRWRHKTPKSIPKHLSPIEVAKVKLQTEKRSIRDRAIIALMFSSGIRRNELHLLNFENIDLENRTAVVHGKGNKNRIIHFSEETALFLQELIKYHPQTEKALFLNKYNKRLSDRYIYELTKQIEKNANLTRPFSPHICRHTFATTLVKRGANIKFVADELGHVNINTTQIYAKLPDEEVMAVYKKIMG
ncbi:MAG TPA: tyrosine-type recombinase/integrase [Syntrophomonadaceae bacterium]|nr:tyrosine-type recombinase/integrase [Syntrophomonadaceae bacterium]